MPPAVVLEDVTHRFPGDVIALDGVNLAVEGGTIFGVLGPNGAGKTTLLRLVSTLLEPTSGRVEVLGLDAIRRPEAVRRRLGVALDGERSVYWRLTGRENLLYAAALHDVPSSTAAARVNDLLAFAGLADRSDALVEGYSTGMRQRLALARALVADPAVLVLDEPTAGLDPRAADEVRALLGALARDGGRTILLATHNMAEAERLCTAVGMLDRGRLVATGAPVALMVGVSRPSLEAVFLALTGPSPGQARGHG